jgi:hypothetical protein
MKKTHPSWWKLYLLVAGGLGLMLLDARAPFSVAMHEVTECAILFLIWGLIALWLHENRLSLLQVGEDEEEKPAGEARSAAHLVQPRAPETIATRIGGGDQGSECVHNSVRRS